MHPHQLKEMSPIQQNHDWNLRREQATPRGIASAFNVFAEKAENSELWDIEGKRYIDFAGGIAVLNTGHVHPIITAAVEKQSRAFSHTAFQVLPYKPYIELAERLNKLAPGPSLKKTVLFSTGAEAVENAVKIARAYTNRPGVISFVGGFHGRTLLTLAMTGKVDPYKLGFAPFPAETYHVPFPVEHHGISVKDSIKALKNLFKADIEAKKVAAIVIEPIQGEGGFYQAPATLMHHLRQICDEEGILLIADEVQSGIGRTGKIFAMEHYDVEVDLITTAKSLAAGYPLSGVIGKADIMDAPKPGGLGGTYGGNPVACAAALAVLDVIKEENLLERSNLIGQQIVTYLNQIKAYNPMIGDIRTLGAMTAFEIVNNKGEPDPENTKALTSKAIESGLILLSCGLFANTIRILVPLTVTDKILKEGLKIMEETINSLAIKKT